MAKMQKIEIETVNENSMDSDEKEYLGMVEEPCFGSSGSERAQLVAHTFLENNEDDSNTYHYRELPRSVTYKIVHVSEDETTNNMAHDSPTHVIPSGEFYVISNPEDVFGSESQKKPANRRQPLQAKAVSAKKRDDKRRATHNEVERRRRDKINTWITQIAGMIPNCGQHEGASKGGILAKACEHIADLTMKEKRLETVEKENAKLVLEVLRLNREVAELRKENSSMRVQLADNCIVPNLQRAKGQKS